METPIELTCPICGTVPNSEDNGIVLDGGSTLCSNPGCGTMYHLCKIDNTIDCILSPVSCCFGNSQMTISEVLELREKTLSVKNTIYSYDQQYSVKQLKQKCRERGLHNYSKLNNLELIRLLMKDDEID